MEGAKKVGIKFLLPNTLTGSLIGSGGKSIKELIEISGARILVSSATETYPGTSDRVVLVFGAEKSVSDAQALIWEMIGLMKKNEGSDLRLVEWDPRGTSENPGQNDDVEVSARFTIPAMAGGAVLGKGGESIRTIAAETGARISMSSKDEALFTQERAVSVSGSIRACINATRMVIERLASQPEPIPFENRGTSYSSPIAATLGFGGQDGRGRRNGGRGGGRSPSAGNTESKLEPVADTTITLSVPDELIGNIFGRQGSTMREIISLSGAKVVVSARGEYVEGTNNRLVTITGSPSSAQTAHYFITQRLQTPSNQSPRKSAGGK